MMKQHIRTRVIRRSAAVAAVAFLFAACSGSSDGAETPETAPLTDPVAETPVTEAPATEAPAVTDPPATEPTVAATDIPELPCAEYVEESGYPLKACDSGVLVETLQRDLESLFPSIAIDGLYGSQSVGFVEEFQTAVGVEATGLVSEELAAQIAETESLDDADATDDAESDGDDTEATEDADDTAEDETADAITEERCNELIGDAENPDFTADAIEACSELGVDLVGEG